MLLAGASNVLVTANDIRHHSYTGDVDLPTGGVVVVATAAFGGGPAANDRIVAYRFAGNTPDLFHDGTGTSITCATNACTTSVPAGLC